MAGLLSYVQGILLSADPDDSRMAGPYVQGILLSMTAPARFCTSTSRSPRCLQIPYDSLAEHFLQPENITARTVSAQTAVGALVSQFIQSVACRVDTLAPPERYVINQHIIELIVLAMSSTASLREVDGQSIARTAMLERIKQYIEVNIRHPQLSPALVAKHHQISERYQRMLFASTGATISRFILDKRLELCREMLENPELCDYSISQIAFSNGFNDASSFSRKFKEHYGITPKEHRAVKIQELHE